MNTSRKYRNLKKHLLNIDYNELNRLKDDKTSFINLVKCKHHLSLHPYHLSNVKKSLNDKLNEEVCSYDIKLGGIILGFQNVKILDNLAPINTDMCFIHLDIEVEFFIFIPAVEQVHRGIVNKQNNTQVSCLVHKIFNVFLPKPDDVDDWLGSHTDVGQEIQFRITYIDLEGRLPYIRGDLLSIVSEDSGISTSEELATSPKRKKTKHKELQEANEVVTKKRKSRDSQEEIEEPKKKKHKSKKKSIQDPTTESNINSHNEELCTINKNRDELTVKNDSRGESTVKKHKKHKKHKKSKEELIEELKSIYMEKVDVLKEEELDSPKKKKKSKKEKVNLDTSHDLDLSEFFKEECANSSNAFHVAMADAPGRGKQQMSHSTSADIQWGNKEFQLPPDSDLEEILKDTEKPKKKGLKRKASVCDEAATYDSLDDFATPAKKVKRKSK